MKKFWEKLSNYKFVLMVIAAMIVTIVLCGTSIYIYVSTGAINIDLSRPGYEQNREDTIYEEDSTSFSSSGPINSDAMEDFYQRLDRLQDELNGMNSFSSDIMTDEALGL